MPKVLHRNVLGATSAIMLSSYFLPTHIARAAVATKLVDTELELARTTHIAPQLLALGNAKVQGEERQKTQM